MANKDKENHTFLLESFSAHENSIESMAVKILDMEANLIIIEKEIKLCIYAISLNPIKYP
jgi:carbonic anhydrase